MADTKVGTGYIEIRADFSKIKEDLNRFAKYLRSKNFKGLEQLQARMGEFGDESKKSLDKTKKGFLESWKASISLERTMKRLAFLATVGIAYSAWRYLSNSIREASDEAMEFEQGMYHVLTVMDSGKDVLNKFSKSVESLAIAYGKSTKDLSETLYDIISARIPEEHAISALNKITELAFGNMAELRDVGSAVLAIINSYNMEMSQAGYVTDILQKAIKMGRMELSDFAKTLGRVIPQAANYGVSLEETLGVLSTMTNQGTNARESVTSLNRAISMWAERSETAGILAKEGIFGVVEQMVFLDKQQRKTLSGGVRGVKSLNAVMNNYAQAVINTKEVVENVGAAQEASNKMQMSLMTQLNQAIEKNKKSWRGAGEIWTEWRIVFTHISAAIGEMFKYILIIPGFFAKIFKGNKKTSEQAKAISDNQKAALEYLKEQGYQINWNNGLLEILNKTNEEITNQDAVRFNHLKSQAETIHSQIAAYSKEIKNLQFQYKINENYGKSNVSTQNEIVRLLQNRIAAYERLINLGSKFAGFEESIKEDMLEISRLNKFDDSESPLYKLLIKLTDKTQEFGVSIEQAKTLLDVFLLGGRISTTQLNFEKATGHVKEYGSSLEKITTSRTEWEKFHEYLKTVNLDLAALFKKIYSMPEATPMERFIDSISGKGIKENKFKSFIDMLSLMQGSASTVNESIFDIFNGKYPVGTKKEFKRLKITVEDLQAALDTMGLKAVMNLNYIASKGDNAGEYLEELTKKVTELNRMIKPDKNSFENYLDMFSEFEKVLALSSGTLSDAFFSGDLATLSVYENKLKGLGVNYEDLSRSIKNATWQQKLFMKLYKDSDNLKSVIKWAEIAVQAIETIKETTESYLSDIAAQWATLLMEGENSLKAFEDFFKGWAKQIVVEFSRMVAKMIAEWLILKALMALTGGVDSQSGYRGVKSALGGYKFNSGRDNVPTLIPAGLPTAMNSMPGIKTNNIINVYPVFNAKFDPRSMGFVVREGSKFNDMVQQ